MYCKAVLTWLSLLATASIEPSAEKVVTFWYISLFEPSIVEAVFSSLILMARTDTTLELSPIAP